MTITSHIQGFDLGPKVTLFQLDLTEFDLGLLYLAPGTIDATEVEDIASVGYGGEMYSPHPIEAHGFELSTNGPLPRPTFAVGNLDNSFTALVEQNDDLHGAILTRIRTYGRYLDDGAEPDGDKHLPLDIYQFSQKTKHSPMIIQWDCSALMDQEGVQLPGRQIVRDFCDHPYRRWNGASFDYTNVTCPYVGTDYFDTDDDATTAANDSCSKRLSGCRARFGANGVLPTRAFPGVARVRLR